MSAPRSDELMRRALTQVRVRQARLFDVQEFWRTYSDNGRRGNRNWARGIAWQILGLTRTLAVAKDRDDITDLIIYLQRRDYRSLYQMGMGLMAQPLAALEVE